MPHPQASPKSKIKKRLALTFAAFAALFLLAIALLVLSGLNDRLGHADVALVLGNKVELDGTPSARLRARLDRTLELFNAGYFSAIIVSGGTGREGFDEAAVMKAWLVSKGVPEDKVIVDSHGITTFLSAKNTHAIARERNFQSVFVISQYFHIPRSRLALQRFGLHPIYTAHARYFEPRDIYSTIRELFGYLSYRFRNYTPEPSSEPATD
jgi:vancomycin permeability regulator SanA